MTSTQSPITTDDPQGAGGGEAPLVNPGVAPPPTAAPPVTAVEHRSPWQRLLAAFGIGRIR